MDENQMTEPSFSFIGDHKLPLVIKPINEDQANVAFLLHYLQEKNALIKEQLLKTGAILLRGFGVTEVDDFAQVVNHCDLGNLYNYDKCAVVRKKIKEGMYTSIIGPPALNVPLHNEKSYSADFPSHIYFNCVTPAKKGGNTPLLDGQKLWQSLPEQLKQKLDKGIIYRRKFYTKGLRWKIFQFFSEGQLGFLWEHLLGTNNKKKASQLLKEQGYTFKWLPRGAGLITELLLPAYRMHPETGESVWFNQSSHNNYYYNIRHEATNAIKNSLFKFVLSQRRFMAVVTFYGDGEPLTKSDADILSNLMQKAKISIPWQKGDVLVIDNYRCLHGKEPHVGERLILASMTKPDEKKDR